VLRKLNCIVHDRFRAQDIKSLGKSSRKPWVCHIDLADECVETVLVLSRLQELGLDEGREVVFWKLENCAQRSKMLSNSLPGMTQCAIFPVRRGLAGVE